MGQREVGEYGYYKKLARVEKQVRKAILTTIIAIAFIIATVVVLGKVASNNSGHYVPDCVDENGRLIDTDGDGDFYHWED